MTSEQSPDVKFEIGHVLFIDIVGYSKLLINEQSDRIQKLKEIVRGTEQFRLAEAEGKLLRLPTGDGGALVFRNSPEAPVLCALEIDKALKSHPELRVRMGIHSGPVNEVTDLNEQANMAGAGINIAQRVMDCGDTGHILLSKRVAEDLAQYSQWEPHLYDLGEVEVKHGVRIHVFNLYNEDLGNAEAPGKFQQQRTAQSASVGVESKSLVVLPLVNQSADPDQEYFSDGLTEELINCLGRIRPLVVIGRNSSFAFKGRTEDSRAIGQTLGVANLLEGSVRKAGDRVRISVGLVKAADGSQLWTQTYDRELKDVFAVQEEIARAIGDQLRATLLGDADADSTRVRSAKGDAEVNDLFLQGLYFSNKSGEEALRKALSFFQKALDKDPKFSRAWTGIAHVWLRLADAYVKPLDAYPIAQAAAERALALDERDPVAHGVLGFSKQVLYWDQEAMFKESQRAVEIDPNSALAHVWYGDTFRGRGDLNRAIEEYRIAARLDPLSPRVSDSLAGGYMKAGKLDEAIAQGKRTLELDPTYAYLDLTLANAYREKELFEQAIGLYQQGQQFARAPSRGLAITYARAGKRREAEQILARFLAEREEKYISAAAIGLIYAALGDKDEAFRWCERAYDEHDAILTTIAFYPGSQPLRNDPRFINLVKRVGLDPSKAIPHRTSRK